RSWSRRRPDPRPGPAAERLRACRYPAGSFAQTDQEAGAVQASAWLIIVFAALIGIAKPRPCADWLAAVTTPMTSPDEFTRGPPLLPGLMAASVWMRLLRLTVCPRCSP